MKHAREDYQGRIVDLAGAIPQGEPVMLFRAQDIHAPKVLAYYLLQLSKDPAASEELALAVWHQIRAMQEWQRTMACKAPDLPPEPPRSAAPPPTVMPGVVEHLRDTFDMAITWCGEVAGSGQGPTRAEAALWLQALQVARYQLFGAVLVPGVNAPEATSQWPDLRTYLDRAITNWRAKVRETKDPQENLIARCYVDAYQSVRASLLGDLLPPEQPPTPESPA